jgi:hypothetical protein
MGRNNVWLSGLLAGLCLFGVTGSAKASENDGALVDSVRVDKNGLGFVQLNVTTGGTPACAAGFGGYFMKNLAFDTNTAGGKSMLSLLTSAKVAGVHIHTWGTGTCVLYGGYMEDLNLLILKKQ